MSLFIIMGSHGSENAKTLPLPQVWFFFNQPFSKYSLLHSSQTLLIGILNCLKKNEIFVNMGPYGSETFKAPILLQWWFFVNQTFSECCMEQTWQKLPHEIFVSIWGTFNLLVQGFLGSFSVLVSKWPVTQKWLALERNSIKFGRQGLCLYVYGVPLTC